MFGYGEKPYITFLNIISSICYYIFASSYILNKKYSLLKFLRRGIDLFNFSTLVVYLFTVLNLVDLISFFRDDTWFSTGYSNIYDRFSFGNPIETPFMISMLLFIVMLSNPKKPILFSAMLNLSAAIISGSRLITVIALLIFLHELLKTGFKYKLSLTLLVICFSYFYSDIFNLIFGVELFSDRISGFEESKSAIERVLILSIFLDAFSRFEIYQILFGNGFNYSYELLSQYFGIERTAESLVIQLITDVGFTGLFLTLYNVIKNSFNYNFLSIQGLLILFLYIQLLFFLPVFTFMQVAFLLLGFIKINKLNTTS